MRSINRLLLTLIFVSLAGSISAQNVYTIKADSVKLTNCDDSTELILENHTQGIRGFLYNTGSGRTIFKKAVTQVGDSLFIVGAATIRGYWKAAGNNIYNVNSGRVGIHRNAPNVLLDLPGPINIDDTSSYRINYRPISPLSALHSCLRGAGLARFPAAPLTNPLRAVDSNHSGLAAMGRMAFAPRFVASRRGLEPAHDSATARTDSAHRLNPDHVAV